MPGWQLFSSSKRLRPASAVLDDWSEAWAAWAKVHTRLLLSSVPNFKRKISIRLP